MKIIYRLIILCSVHFFGLHFLLGDFMFDLIDLMFYIVIFFMLLGNFLFNREKYKIPKSYRYFTKPIAFLFFTLVLSALSGFAYHDQSPFLTLLGMRYFSYFLLYFVFISFGIDKSEIIKTIMLGVAIYIVVFSTQLYLYPSQIVSFDTSTSISRGFLRLRLEGVGFITLTAFYSLNTYLLNKTKKKYLLLFFICFIYIFILGFRTLLITFVFSSLVLIVMNSTSVIKIIRVVIPLFLFVVVLWQLDMFRDFILNSVQQTEDQTREGDEYIRILAFDFLFNIVNVDFGSLFFGNGFPIQGTSYGDLVLLRGAKKNGFISADLGLIGFVFNYGLLSLFAFLNIFRIAIFKKTPKHSNYLKVFFVYLIISSITTSEIYRAGMFGVEMIALYLVTIANFDKISEEKVSS